MKTKPSIGEACNGCGLCCRLQVCSAGSYALGLVETYGERAPGPCPALVQRGDTFTCGVVERPKDWLESDRGVMPLRAAFSVLIGAGLGCDEAGDEPDETALPKLRRMQEAMLKNPGVDKIRAAAELVHGRKR